MQGPMSWSSARRVQLSRDEGSLRAASIQDDLPVVELRQSSAFSNQTATARSSALLREPTESPSVKLPTSPLPAGAAALPVALPVALAAGGSGAGTYRMSA